MIRRKIRLHYHVIRLTVEILTTIGSCGLMVLDRTELSIIGPNGGLIGEECAVLRPTILG